MNRHIERLVEAAPYTTISSEGRLFTQQNMAEFAKSLIKECAEQIMLKGTDWMDWAPSQQAVRPEYVAMAKHIKQYFGIER